MFGMVHLRDGDLEHVLGQIFVSGILQTHMEIHILQRRGDLLAQGVVQQRDALGILVIRLVHK